MLADGDVTVSSPGTHITGNVGLGPRTTGSLIKATIDGELIVDPTSTATIGSDLTVSCGTVSQDLSGADADARAAAAFLASKSPTQTFGSITSTTTITSAGGENVIAVTSIDLLKQNLNLVGGPSDTFIFNVTGAFSCRGTCHINLSGGLTDLNVIFNVLGTGTTVTIKDPGVVANGIFLAPRRSVLLDKATLNGAIIGGGVAMTNVTAHSGAQLIFCPPCPACRPAALVTSLALAGSGGSRALTAGSVPVGIIQARGILLTGASTDVLDTTSGIAVRIQDSLDLDHTVTYAVDACHTSTSGSVVCRDADGLLRTHFLPRRMTPGAYLFKLTFQGLDIHGPFEPDVTINIMDSTGDHVGVIAASACTEGPNEMSCRRP